MNQLFKVLIASGICLVGVVTSVEDMANAQDVDKIKQLMRELNTEITQYLKGSGDVSEFNKELPPVVNAMQTLRKKNLHDYVIATMKDLTSLLKGTTTLSKDPKVINEAFKLAPKIAELESKFPFLAAKNQTSRLTDLINKNKPLKNGTFPLDEFGVLLKILEEASEFNAFTSAKNSASRLTELIKNTPSLDMGEIPLPEFNLLLKELLDAEELYPFYAANRRANSLKAVLDNRLKGHKPKLRDIGGLLPLLKTLEKLEEEESMATIRRRVATIKRLIKENDAKVKKDESVKIALADLEAAIEKVIPDSLGRKIHVVKAIYGDVSSGASPTRQCQAVRAVMNQCQAKNECTVNPPDPKTLCDEGIPSDFNLISGKRLKVTYGCILADPEVWEQLEYDRQGNFLKYQPHTITIPIGNKIVCRRAS